MDLKNQVKKNTFHDVEQLQNKIRTEQKSRELLLEEIKESEQKLKAVVVTRIINRPNSKVANIFICTGKNRKE